MAKVASVFYSNEAHSELKTALEAKNSAPGGDYDWFVDLTAAADIPVVWSTQGIDLDLMQVRNPGLIQKLHDSKNITFTQGLYSHALPSFFSEHLDLQFAAGKNSMIRNLGNRISPVIMVSEFDVNQGMIPQAVNAGGSYILLHAGSGPNAPNKLYNDGVISDKKLARLSDESGKSSITGIVTEGPGVDRKYLGMLDGFVTPQEVVQALISEANSARAKGYPMTSWLTDFEGIQIGARDVAKANFELFVNELSKAHKSGTLELSGFDGETLGEIDDYMLEHKSEPCLNLSSRPKGKWKTEPSGKGKKWENIRGGKFFDAVKNMDVYSLSEYHRLAYLWVGGSDVYSALSDFGKSEDGIVRMVPFKKDGVEVKDQVFLQGDANRVAEVEHVIAAIKDQKPVNLESVIELSPESKEKMGALHKVFAMA